MQGYNDLELFRSLAADMTVGVSEFTMLHVTLNADDTDQGLNDIIVTL